MTVAADALDLTRPEPTALPHPVLQAAKDALDRGETHYTNRPGVLELREAIAERSTADGFPATPASTLVTNGGTEGLYVALQGLVEPGDTVLVVEPVAPRVIDLLNFIGARVHRVSPSAEERFVPRPDAFASSRAPVLLMASPSPITGVAIPPHTLAQIVEVALKQHMRLILDRSSAAATYDPLLARFPDPSLAEQIVTIGSFSHAYGLGGWRIGYVTAPKDLIGKLSGLKQAMSICTTAVSQYAALAALQATEEWLVERRAEFAQRRDRVVAQIEAVGLSVVSPDAYPPLLIDVRSSGSSDTELAQHLAANGIVVQMGSAFGQATAGFLRINLGAPTEHLEAGIDRIAQLREGGK
jgi:aspartate/methionine/tyrosine aminotransferase